MSFRDAVEYAGYSFASAMTRILPLSLLYGLCRAFGSIAWHRGGKQARIAKENLRIAFPNVAQEERDRIGRESFVEFSRNTIDFLRAERWDAETLRAHDADAAARDHRGRRRGGVAPAFPAAHPAYALCCTCRGQPDDRPSVHHERHTKGYALAPALHRPAR